VVASWKSERSRKPREGDSWRDGPDIVLGNTGHRWGKAWLVGEETPSIGEVVQ
jgi:hypothetical protein